MYGSAGPQHFWENSSISLFLSLIKWKKLFWSGWPFTSIANTICSPCFCHSCICLLRSRSKSSTGSVCSPLDCMYLICCWYTAFSPFTLLEHGRYATTILVTWVGLQKNGHEHHLPSPLKSADGFLIVGIHVGTPSLCPLVGVCRTSHWTPECFVLWNSAFLFPLY